MNVLAFGTSTQAIEPGYRGSLKTPGDQRKPRWLECEAASWSQHIRNHKA